MRYAKLCLAFGLGWLSVIAISFVIDVFAQRGKSTQPSPLQQRITALQARVILLEQLAQRDLLVKRFAAPFEVTDRAGRRVFYVSRDRDVEYYRNGKIVAEMSAMGGGGTFWVLTADGKSRLSLTGDSLKITENDVVRLDVGRSAQKGNYRLLIYSAGGNAITGIGESTEPGTGLGFVADQSGLIKARIGFNKAGRPAVDVNGATNSFIARLTEGEQGGGVLLICGPNNCDPPMVDAGDLGAYGVVRTGPEFYNPGVGLMGVPGSFLIGKPQ